MRFENLWEMLLALSTMLGLLYAALRKRLSRLRRLSVNYQTGSDTSRTLEITSSSSLEQRKED